MQQIAVVGLMRIELPTGTVNLCEAGFFTFDGAVHRGRDATFGTVDSVESMTEGRGDEIPALQIDLLPPGTAAASALSQPGFQTSRLRSWIGEYDIASGLITGTPELMFDGQVDQTTLRIGAARTLSLSAVQTAERIFELDIGNSLSPTFHKSVWPGELGHDEATGLKVQVAWGVEKPIGATGGGSGGGRGGFGGSFARQALR